MRKRNNEPQGEYENTEYKMDKRNIAYMMKGNKTQHRNIL